ncbi:MULTISPECIES: ABC transporter substrate-binding protein [unclassified Pseudofrankia]|uniref:ABC transporter substrate-binding protein n=1 Tax=unclassified Pseudofrankia TaxID=2994372 RepID=UPI000B0CCFC4|nr:MULTISPECIES: ABC transporter substrate-binding protein [unclassified Pseudofrankia]MDT3439289.1 ABC transporter substrate-binding protein [Pseudofrankia sp. BMG5.37]
MATLVATAASCASSSGGSGTNAACDSPGVTPSQVTLGFIYPASGASSSALSAARAGIDARIGLANEQGGMHGRRITYQWRDDENTSSVTARATEELVQQEHVFGLVAASASLGGSLDSLAQQGIPVAGLAVDPAWAGRENMFSFIYSASQAVVGRYIREAHGTKVAIITAGQSADSAANVTLYEQGLRAAGVSAVEVFPYAVASGSPAQLASKIMAFGADALLGIIAPEGFGQVVQATRAAGAHLAVSVVLAGYDHSVLAADGQALAGVSMPVFFRPFEAGGPAIERYHSAMDRYAPEARDADQQFAMFTYINTDLFLRGLYLAGPCPTRDSFIKALRSVSSYDADGLIEPVDLRDYSGKPLSCYSFVQVAPGGAAFQLVRKRVCADGTSG